MFKILCSWVTHPTNWTTLQDGLGAPESIAWGFHIRDPQRNSEEKCIVETGMGTNISLNTIKYIGKLRIV